MTQGNGGSDPEVGDRLSALLNEVELRLDEGFADEAFEIARQAHRLLERHDDVGADLRIDAHYLLASCYFERREVLSALREYEKVRDIDAKDGEIDYWQARALFHCWRFDEAHQLLDRFQANPNTRAGSLYYRALTEDFCGRPQNAESYFQRAEEEDPTEFPRPLRLPPDEVAGMLAEVRDSLPDEVRGAVEHVQVEVHPLPDPRIHASPGLDPLVLGLCKHGGQTGRGPRRTPFAGDSIEIYQRNVERVATDRDEFREELRMTLLHEIGHHLGEERAHGESHAPLN